MNADRLNEMAYDIMEEYERLMEDEEVQANNSFDYHLGYFIRKNYGKDIVSENKKSN